MATLTMPIPQTASSSRSANWVDPHPAGFSSWPHAPRERIELPSILQTFPDLGLPQRGTFGSDPRNVSPSERATSISENVSEYVPSPNLNKRTRLSQERLREEEERSNHAVPRMYRGPEAESQHSHESVRVSPTGRRGSAYSELSARRSPAMPRAPLPAMPSPTHFESGATRDFRPTLPSFSNLPFDSGLANNPVPDRLPTWSSYAQDPSRPISQAPSHPSSSSTYDPISNRSGYSSPGLQYGSSTSRGASMSGPSSMHPYPTAPERSPFSASFQAATREGTSYDGAMGVMSESSKQRKRRGNLPKETTDKLRSWFVSHLQHPYPTEDEKQELMRQTGLQMNQISNWFINARRRQLPTMVSNAQVETDARLARAGALAPGSENEFDEGKRSGSEGYEDEFETQPFSEQRV